MSPFVISILLIVIAVVFSAPRRWALLAIFAAVLYATQGQAVDIFGLNIFAVRFVEIAGILRVLFRREFPFSRINQIDRAFIIFYLFSTAVFLVRSSENQAFQIGIAVDAFFCYFTFRGLIDGLDDFQWFLRAFLVLLAPYVALILVENFTHFNVFSSMGGIALSNASWFRDGRIRCQGSFRHATLLGTLGASFFPIYWGMACGPSNRKLSIFGIVLCLTIVWASNSGGPLNCAIIVVIGWLLWPMRKSMRVLRRSMAIGVVALALVMKAPIWYLPAKVSDFTGGDGWHRSYLMEMAFKHFREWWFAGFPLAGTKDWFPYVITATGTADITNLFLSIGMASGVVGMILFIRLLVVAFTNLGSNMAADRMYSPAPSGGEYISWGLGVMLVMHIFNWLGITYFDQTYVIWFMQLAAISSICGNGYAGQAMEKIGDASIVATHPANVTV